MPGCPQERALRGGNIRGAAGEPQAPNHDAIFKPVDALKAICEQQTRFPRDDVVVAHCPARNCDESWTEWGNLVRAPIER